MVRAKGRSALARTAARNRRPSSAKGDRKPDTGRCRACPGTRSRAPEPGLAAQHFAHRGPATRLDLEREAHLGRAVVSDRLATLTAFGLIDEGGVGRSIGGRAPRLVRFRPEAGRVLVANIDVDTIGVGLADLSGRLIVEHYEDFDFTASATRCSNGWKPCSAGGGDRTARRYGRSGWAFPAWSRSATNCAWQFRRSARGRPCATRCCWNGCSSVQGADLGAQRRPDGDHGRDRRSCRRERARDMLYVDLGSEISAGVVIGGRLQRGSQGIAGQVGHAYAGEAYTRVCGCGNVGCLQTVAGCDAIAREGLAGARGGLSPLLAETLARTGGVTVADIGTAARLGDPFSADLLARCGRLVGTVLSTLVNVLNPSMIVIGGELAQTGDICSPPSARASTATHSHCSAGISASCAPAWAARPAWSAPPRWR